MKALEKLLVEKNVKSTVDRIYTDLPNKCNTIQ